MAAFLLYVVKASVLLTLLYSLFALLLRNETFHWFNRIVLLAILFLSLVVPLVPVTLAHPVIASAPLAQAESWVRLNEFTVTSQSTASTPVHISGVWILSALYLLGVAFCMFQFLRSLLSLALFIHFGTRVCMDEVPGQMLLMVKPGLSSPFSWMRWIVVSPADLQQDFRPILLHETAHARLCHSLDLVLCQLVCCLLWFCPFVWLLRQDLRGIHEFQADRQVLLSGISATQYMHLLLRKAVGNQQYVFANNFNHSLIKKRFTMMKKRKSNPWMTCKVLYIIPVLALAVNAFAKPAEQAPQELSLHIYKNGNCEWHLGDSLLVPEHPREIVEKVLKNGDVVLNLSCEEGTPAEKVDDYMEICRKAGITKVYKLITNYHQDEDVDVKASFPGGEEALYQYLRENIRYPEVAQKLGVSGIANISFVVKADGSIDHSIKCTFTTHDSSEDSELTSEEKRDMAVKALRADGVRVVNSMPRWNPAMKDGKPVDSRYTLPVTFRLIPKK